MKLFELQRDYKYFCSIWDSKKPGGATHTPESWDGRAEDWGKELAQDGPFRQSVSERVNKVAEYLRHQGLLDLGSQVVDIGCGPGRFVAEFAKTAGHVTGVDLSPRMLELGVAYAKECGCHNVSFLPGDFGEFDIDALSWEKKFDLVFTSITPAIGSMESLEKAMRISRGYCFNSCFVRWADDLERQIAQEVFHRKYSPSQDSHGHWFYSLFNLLWLKGYFPETHYHRQDQSKYVKVTEDLAHYYAKCFSADMSADNEIIRRIHLFLRDHADKDGKILRRYTRWYGWILWDVRVKVDRTQEK